MNLNSPAVGLSAGRKINNPFNLLWVLVTVLILILVSIVSTYGQIDLKKAPPKYSNEPKVDIKVNRHFDNKGNVIGYDSTYSSYYSSAEGDTAGMHDLVKNFERHFGEMRTSFFDKHFDNFLPNDSIRPPSFQNDFFSGHSNWHKFLDNVTRELDSLRSRLHQKY